jgi:hypothetical protein
VQVNWLQDRHAVGDGLQVVQQPDGRQVKSALKLRLSDDPGQIGDGGLTTHDGTCHAKAGPLDLQVNLGQELAHEHLQAGVVGAGEGRLDERGSRPGLTRENGQAGLGSTDVTGKKHHFSLRIPIRRILIRGLRILIRGLRILIRGCSVSHAPLTPGWGYAILWLR